MANIKSAKKAIVQAKKREIINKARKSRIHTFIRKVEDAIKAGDKKTAREAFKNLEPEIMRGVTKGVYKLNTASRKLSRIAVQIRKIAEGSHTAKNVVETKAKKTKTKAKAKTKTKTKTETDTKVEKVEE